MQKFPQIQVMPLKLIRLYSGKGEAGILCINKCYHHYCYVTLESQSLNIDECLPSVVWGYLSSWTSTPERFKQSFHILSHIQDPPVIPRKSDFRLYVSYFPILEKFQVYPMFKSQSFNMSDFSNMKTLE